jgi:hypothetical protein
MLVLNSYARLVHHSWFTKLSIPKVGGSMPLNSYDKNRMSLGTLNLRATCGGQDWRGKSEHGDTCESRLGKGSG